MIKITLNDISSLLELPVSDINYDSPISDFSIDSRTIKKGDAYIAIEGEKYNGNDFVLDAIKNGATIAFTSNKKYLAPNIFYVKDGKEFLKKIAGFIMKIINPKVIAVTGSNGKTTTKEIIASILQQEYSEKELLIAQGNFNNDIGLPLTILRLNESHKITVLEMGMNHKGEIEDLTRITPPDVAVITNIGDAHIENFESKDGIARIFDLFDDDKSGNINIHNLRRVAKELGETMSPDELKEMLERAASNGDEISFEDFYFIMTKKTFA